MKTRFGEILENAVRLCGRDVSLNEIPADWKVLAGMSINAAIRRLAAEKFWMLTRVESRVYRPPYESDAGWRRGMQCWHGGEYWELTEDASSGEPGVAACWRKLTMAELPAFIAWEQPWENTVIDRGGVDVNRFAYEKDPKYYPNATPLSCVGMSEFGVEIKAPAPKEVFVRFVPVFPSVKFDEWIIGSVHEPGDVVYRSSTKDVYIAQQAIAHPTEQEDTDPTNIPPETPGNTYWQAVRISDDFAMFLTRAVQTDLMTEAQGKEQSRAQAEGEFDLLCERFHEGVGETTVRRGRFR